MKLNEYVKTVEPTEFTKIQDFEKITTNLDIYEKEQTFDGEIKIFQYTKIDDLEVRIPMSVLLELKIQMEANEDLKFFRVVAKGEGKNTRYSVIPLQE